MGRRKYETLSTGEREHIENLAAQFRQSYRQARSIDFDRMAREHDGYITRTDKALHGNCYHINEKHYVFVPESIPPMSGTYMLAHEMGHVLLDKSEKSKAKREDEAHYFAEKLLGFGPHDFSIIDTAWLLLNTIAHPIRFINGRNPAIEKIARELRKGVPLEKALK